MWNYEKRLQFPVKISKPDPKAAQIIITQFGGPDGELAASMRYLSQRYTMPYKEVTGILTDIGTEESVPNPSFLPWPRFIDPGPSVAAGFVHRVDCQWTITCGILLECFDTLFFIFVKISKRLFIVRVGIKIELNVIYRKADGINMI